MNNSDAYWKNRLTKNFNLAGVGFEGIGKSYNSWIYKVRAKFFKTIVKEYLGNRIKSVQALDVGTGTGFYLKLLLDMKVRNLEAMDFNDVTTSNLPIQFPMVSFYNVDISKDLPKVLKEGYDLIVCIDVLFHIVEDDQYKKALHNLFDLLKPGGKLIMTENLSKHRVERGHIVDRTESEIFFQLHQIGFSLLKEIPAFILINKPFKSESKLLLNLSKWRVQVLKFNHQLGLEWVNYLIGFFLYVLEITGGLLSIKGNGTSFVVCTKD